MGRLENWNPNAIDEEFGHVALSRLVAGAEVIAAKARSAAKVGTVSRPMYQTGPYAGQPWTARDAGQLKKSVRVVQKTSRAGKILSKKRSIRVYIGNYLAYYARIVERESPFLRPSFYGSLSQVKQIMGAK